jgi:hypothetical protein
MRGALTRHKFINPVLAATSYVAWAKDAMQVADAISARLPDPDGNRLTALRRVSRVQQRRRQVLVLVAEAQTDVVAVIAAAPIAGRHRL